MADEIWVDVLPSLDGFGAAMMKGVGRSAKEAGAKGGKEYSNAFKNGSQGAADGAVKELETAQKRASGLVQKLAGDVSRARQAQQSSAAALLIAEQKLIDTVGKFGEESSQARAAALRLEAARGKAADSTAKFESAEKGLKEAQKSHTTITDQLTTAQAKLGTEVKQAPGLWGKFTNALDTAGRKLKGFSEGVGGLVTQVAGAVGGAALLHEAFGTALEGDTSIDRLNAALAATPEQAEKYGAATGNLYNKGFGEGMEDVSKSVDAVVSSMGGLRDGSQADIEKITGYALNLAKTFDVDVSEAAATAGTLMKNGLAKNGVDAMDLITGAMSKVPAQVRGEILPTMTEYSKHFAALGIDGETAMGMIVSASADGAIGMDKVGDSLKEFTIRATDMSTTTTGTYKTLGLNSREMTNELLAGGDRAETAMGTIVSAIQSIKDPAAQSQAALNLFGTPLEDLGTDKIPKFLKQVNPMTSSFQDMDGAADKLGGTLRDNTSTSLETIKRSFIGMITDGIKPALEPLNGVLKWAKDTPGVMTAVGVALGIVAVAWAAVTLAASPWLAIGVGIALVIGGIVLAVKNWGKIMNWLGDLWGRVTGGIRRAWGEAVSGIKSWWDRTLAPVLGWVREKVEFTKKVWAASVDIVKNKWADMTTSVRSWWDRTLSPVLGFVRSGIDLTRRGWSTATGKISSLWSGMVTGVKRVWNNVFSPIFDVIKKVLTGDFVGAFESAKKSVGKIWGGVANVVRKPINFVIGTVYNQGIRKVFNKVASLVGIGELGEAAEVPAFAKGGFHKGGWALVGEEGPELVNFKAGQVYTAAESKRLIEHNGRKSRPDEQLMAAAAGATPAEAMAPMGGFWSDMFGGIGHAIGGAVTKGIDWVRGGLAKAAELAIKPIKSGLDAALGTQGFGLMINKSATKILDGAISWLRGKDNEADEESAGGSSVAEFVGPRGPAHRPAFGPFTSGYGPRWGGFHAGVDIAGHGGSYAYQNGVVQKTGWNIGPGRTGIGILINHGKGMWTYYGHNPVGGVRVHAGEEVKGGQRIGAQGHTGHATGDHTHFEVHRGHAWGNVNPMPYLYDQGGILNPGFTPVLSKTRRPERVLTEPQWHTAELAIERTISDGTGGTINVTIAVQDLEGIRTLEEFITMARRRARQNGGK